MKMIKFGMYYEIYGYQTAQVPDNITTEEEALDWLEDNFEHIPLPDDVEFIDDSAGYDDCTIELYEDNINECKSN